MSTGPTPCGTAQARSHRAEAEYRQRERHQRISGYGVVKEIEVLSALPVEEQMEYRRFQRRAHRSSAAEQRLHELQDRAHQLHQAEQQRRAEEPPDTWFEELKERMWARRA